MVLVPEIVDVKNILHLRVIPTLYSKLRLPVRWPSWIFDLQKTFEQIIQWSFLYTYGEFRPTFKSFRKYTVRSHVVKYLASFEIVSVETFYRKRFSYTFLKRFNFWNKMKNKKYHTVGTVPKYHTVVTVPKYHTVGTVPKYHTVVTVPKYHTVGTVPKYHIVLTVPRSNRKIPHRRDSSKI